MIDRAPIAVMVAPETLPRLSELPILAVACPLFCAVDTVALAPSSNPPPAAMAVDAAELPLLG